MQNPVSPLAELTASEHLEAARVVMRASLREALELLEAPATVERLLVVQSLTSSAQRAGFVARVKATKYCSVKTLFQGAREVRA